MLSQLFYFKTPVAVAYAENTAGIFVTPGVDLVCTPRDRSARELMTIKRAWIRVIRPFEMEGQLTPRGKLFVQV